MYNIRKVLKISGVRSYNDTPDALWHQCPRHTNGDYSLKIFLVNGSPVFKCHRCGDGMDPITFYSKSANVSLDKAAEVIMKADAFMGDISGELKKAKMVKVIMDLHERKAQEFKIEIEQARTLNFVKSDLDNWTLMNYQSMVDLREFLETATWLRSKIRVGPGIEKKLVLKVLWNSAGAPGKMDIHGVNGEFIRSIQFDSQTPGSHIYFSAPKMMVYRPWDENMVLFPSSQSAEKIWDWAMGWAGGCSLPVLAVDSVKGEFRKIDTKKVTICPIGDETSLVGTVFSIGDFSDVKVLRIDLSSVKKLHAKEVFYPIRTPIEWAKYPSVTQDFISQTMKFYERHEDHGFRKMISELLEKSYMSQSGKVAILDRIRSMLPLDGQSRLDQAIDSGGVTRLFSIDNHTYVAGLDSYIKRGEASESKITNFRSSICIRLNQLDSASKKKGPCSYVVKTRVEGYDDSIYSVIPEGDFYSPGSLLRRIRQSCSSLGTPIPVVTTSIDERRLPKIICGTQGESGEVNEISRMGYDTLSMGFNFPGVHISPGGEKASESPQRILLERIWQDYIQGWRDGNNQSVFDFGALDETGTVSYLVALAVNFFFQCSRSRNEYRVATINGPLAHGLAKVSGMKVFDDRWILRALGDPLIFSGIPCVLSGVSFNVSSKFSTCVCITDQIESFRYRNHVDEIPESLDLSLDLPTGNMAEYISASLISVNQTGMVNRLLAKSHPNFRRRTHEALDQIKRTLRSELDKLLDFLKTSNGSIYVTNNEDRVLISSESVRACFGDIVSPRRIFEQLRIKVNGDIRSIIRRPTRITEWSVPNIINE